MAPLGHRVRSEADVAAEHGLSPTELVARIKAALRKREAPEWAEPPEPYVFGDLTVDYAERRVTLAGRPVQLTAIGYGLLFEL